jgi:hypothetical protein
MVDVIEFLERWGREAQLRYADATELTQALTLAEIDPFVRKAILAADQRHLEFLLGARANVCCLIYSPDEKEDEEEEEREDEDGDEEEHEEKLKSPGRACRRVA